MDYGDSAQNSCLHTPAQPRLLPRPRALGWWVWRRLLPIVLSSKRRFACSRAPARPRTRAGSSGLSLSAARRRSYTTSALTTGDFDICTLWQPEFESEMARAGFVRPPVTGHAFTGWLHPQLALGFEVVADVPPTAPMCCSTMSAGRCLMTWFARCARRRQDRTVRNRVDRILVAVADGSAQRARNPDPAAQLRRLRDFRREGPLRRGWRGFVGGC